MMKIRVNFYLVTVLNKKDTQWYDAGIENVLAIADSAKAAKQAVANEYATEDVNYKFVAVKKYHNYVIDFPVDGTLDLIAAISEKLDEDENVKVAYTVYGDDETPVIAENQ